MTNAFGAQQLHYRFAEEDGTQATSTLLGTEDVALSRNVAADSNIQLRILINEVGGGTISGATNATWQLQRSIAGGAFANVTTTSTGVKVNTGSALTDGGTTSSRLTAPVTFNAGQQDDQNGAVTFTHPGNICTEHVFGLTLVAADLADGNAVTFQLLYNGALLTTTQNGAYTVTPQLNITTALNFTANTLPGTVALSGIAPAVAADAAAAPTLGTLSIAGQAPTVGLGFGAAPDVGIISFRGYAPDVPQGLTERLSPNTRVAGGSNLRDSDLTSPPVLLSDLADETSGSPGPDALWWTAVNPEADIDVRLGFPTPSGNLVGTQTLRVYIRGTSLPSRNITLELWQAGSKLTSETTVAINSLTGQVVSLQFQPDELAGGSPTSGPEVELRIRATAA